MINYTEDVVPSGLVKGGFDITFFNVGEVEAKDVMTKWTIIDHGRKITGLNEWLMSYLDQAPLIIKSIPSQTASSLKYVPDMTTYGAGEIILKIDYSYIDANTNKTYTEQYKGSTYYKILPNNIPKAFAFVKLEE